MYQALYRKYRPRSFDDVVGQEHITMTLKNQVRQDKLSHAYLFIGTRGTGKTTCAKILAKAVNCLEPQNGNPCGRCSACRGIDDGTIMDVVELDAASNNGVDHVRALRDEAIFSPAGAKKRVYIIDEVHMLSTPAFNALLKIMEEPPAHLMFILATTELKKVPATILSRCQRHTFKRIDAATVAGRLQYVARQEGLTMTPQAAELLGRLADGSMRDGLSLMDQVLGDGNITEDSVLSATGLAGSIFTAQLLELVMARDTQGALELFHRLWNDGKDPALLLGELSTLLRDLLLYLTAPDGCGKLLSGSYSTDTIRDLSRGIRPAMLMRHMEAVQSAQDKLKDSRNQRMTVELCLIGMCDPALSDDLSALRARIEELERRLDQGIPVQTSKAEPAPRSQPAPKPAPKSPAPMVEDLPPWEDPPVPVQEPPRRRLSYEEMMAGGSAPKAAPPAEDRPPWDEAPPPFDDYDRPPLPEEPPVFDEPPAPVKAPAPKKAAPAAGPAPDWEPFMNIARPIIGLALSGLLPQCSGSFTPDCLIITAPPFPYGQMNTPVNLAKLKQAAQQHYGRPVDVKLESAAPGAPRPATRSLDELKNEKFSSIVKFK